MRFQQLGLTDHWINLTSRELEVVDEYAPENWPLSNFGLNLASQVDRFSTIAIGFFLQNDSKNAKYWAAQVVTEAIRYFFGNWRNSMPDNPHRPEDNGYWARGGGSWMDIYRVSIAFGCALDEWKSAKHLSEFPHESKSEASSWAAESPWYVLLAEHFARGDTPRFGKLLQSAKTTKNKAVRFCALAIESIIAKDQEQLQERFEEQMEHYLEHQKLRDAIEYKLAIDGTILFHLARREKMEIIMPDEWRNHLLIF